jgi:AraC-like DNA-binding protein
MEPSQRFIKNPTPLEDDPGFCLYDFLIAKNCVYTQYMQITRAPHPLLSPLVKQVWVSDSPSTSHNLCERVLPNAHMHLVLRLDAPLELIDPVSESTKILGQAIVGGVRDRYYLKSGQGSRSIGAMLQFGAAPFLFGASAAELAQCHTPLQNLWGGQAYDLLEKLLAEPHPEQQLQLFEYHLFKFIKPQRVLSEPLKLALQALDLLTPVDTVVKQSGLSHRHFNQLFYTATGFSPKRYSRIQRFNRLLKEACQIQNWAEVAQKHHYSDQAHLIRDFQAFSGLSPRVYQELAPVQPNHVFCPQVNFLQDSKDIPQLN